jgi:hypothetical protein
MEKWEYKVLLWDGTYMKGFDSNRFGPGVPDLTGNLNEHGDNAWELIVVVTVGAHQGLVLKRLRRDQG